MRFISGVLVTFVAFASLVSAECSGRPSMSCDFLKPVPPWVGDGPLCNSVCKQEGQGGGSCVKGPGCSFSTCTCYPARKRREATNDDDEGLVNTDLDLDSEIQGIFRTLTQGLDGDFGVEVENYLHEVMEDPDAKQEAQEFFREIMRNPDFGFELKELLPAILEDPEVDAEVKEFLRTIANEDDEDDPGNIETRDALEKRTVFCAVGPFSNAACHARCFWIGKSGGSCNSIDNVCVCYQN